MDEPEPGRMYVFVRPSGGAFDVEQFAQHPHGAFLFGGRRVRMFHGPSAAWREALRELGQTGYVELTEAIRRGLLTKDEADSLLG